MKINRAAYEALSEEERAEVDAILADVAEAVEDNPLYAFFPHPKQAAFLAARQRKKIVTGGNRSGKTEISIANDIIQCVDRESLPPHLREYKHLDGPVKGRIVVPKFNENHEQVTFPKIRSLVPKGQLQGGSWEKAFSKQRRVLHFENGSTIQFLTFEQDVDAHASADLDFVHFDEEPPGEHGWQIYRENLARLIDRNGYFFLSMTPLFGMCVDTKTECLTKRGWTKHDDLRPDDKLLTYNLDDEVTEWAPLRGVYRDENYNGPMVRQSGRRRVDAYFTPNHRWVTKKGLRRWDELPVKEPIILAAPHRSLNEDQWPLGFLELLGWVLSEGSLVPSDNKTVIYQSATRYPQHCARIEELLAATGAQYHVGENEYEIKDGTGIIRRYVITGDVSRLIRFLVGHPKKLRPELVASLGDDGARALLKGLLDGDGHYLENGGWHFTATDQDLADSVAMLGLLTGERVRQITYETAAGNTVHRVYQQTSGKTLGAFRKLTEEAEAPADGVWCPSTTNGTFVARRNGKVYITGNSWTYDEFWEKRGQEVAKDTFATDKLFLVQVDMDDNPHLSEEAKQDYLDGLTEEEKQARKKGQFVHFGGLVYGEFDRDTHVVSEPRISHIAEMDTIVSIDPGIRTTGIVFVGFDRDNVAWLYDELYLHNDDAIPENAARLIKGKLDNWEVADPTFIIDPSARNRASVNADNVQAAYFRAGILTLPAQNAVEAGIFEVKRRLQSTPPMLRISERCERWLWERTRYRIKPQEAIEKFEVVKRDDHLMDAFRYAAMARPIAPNFLTPKKARRHAFTPDYQPPYSEETPPVETGPLGPMS